MCCPIPKSVSAYDAVGLCLGIEARSVDDVKPATRLEQEPERLNWQTVRDPGHMTA